MYSGSKICWKKHNRYTKKVKICAFIDCHITIDVYKLVVDINDLHHIVHHMVYLKDKTYSYWHKFWHLIFVVHDYVMMPPYKFIQFQMTTIVLSLSLIIVV